MHLLYIDPGTGSMLFAILVGLIGALGFLLKGWFVKLRFILSGGKKTETADEVIPIAIFTDDKRYWNLFKPVCDELEKREVKAVYMTASSDDPALETNYKYISSRFIGEGNRAFAKLNFLSATLLLSTTPGIDVFQWKRSKKVKYYVHIPHMVNDITLYRMFGIDYYDAILPAGEVQYNQVRSLEKLRNLPQKELVTVGVPYMDSMLERLKSNPAVKNEEVTVLLAPSWGNSGILSKLGDTFIDELINTGYRVIIRPHPQSFTSEAELMSRLMEKYPSSDRLEWNRDGDNFDVLNRSDILISDFSGVIFDFALVYDKPVIFTDTDFDKGPYDAWWLDEPIWTFETLEKIGAKLTADNMSNIKAIIDECLFDSQYSQGREQARQECWSYIGESASRTAEYLENKYNELIGEEEKK